MTPVQTQAVEDSGLTPSQSTKVRASVAVALVSLLVRLTSHRTNDPGECGAIVNYPAPTFTGNCGTVTASQASGTFFPVGTTTVVVTGERLDGTSDTCSFTVTVSDTESPVVSTPTTNPNTSVATQSPDG